VERSHQEIFQWVHRVSNSVGDLPEAQLKWVAVDETAIKINDEWSWLYTATDLDTKLIIHVQLLDDMAPIQRLRSYTASVRNVIPPTLCFSSIS